jgi:hypothetical protein
MGSIVCGYSVKLSLGFALRRQVYLTERVVKGYIIALDNIVII